MFRAQVMLACDLTCAICRLKYAEMLDAAHIIADCEAHGASPTPHGLALCKIHHAAFDNGGPSGSRRTGCRGTAPAGAAGCAVGGSQTVVHLSASLRVFRTQCVSVPRDCARNGHRRAGREVARPGRFLGPKPEASRR